MTLTGNKPGRPRSNFSRRRFHLAVAALNRVLKQPTATNAVVIRSAELLCFIYYGGILPGGVDKRDKRDVRTLCLEHNLIKAQTASIDEQMEAERIQEVERQDQEQSNSIRQMFAAALDLGRQIGQDDDE